MPMSRRVLVRLARLAVISVPSTLTLPLVGASSMFKHRNRVLLPEPLGPMMTSTSPWATSRSMPRRTVFVPKALHSPRTSTTASGIGLHAAVHPLGGDRERQVDDQVDQGNEQQHLDLAKRACPNRLGGVEQF